MKMLKGPTGLVLVGVIFICTFAGLASSELQPDVRQQLEDLRESSVSSLQRGTATNWGVLKAGEDTIYFPWHGSSLPGRPALSRSTSMAHLSEEIELDSTNSTATVQDILAINSVKERKLVHKGSQNGDPDNQGLLNTLGIEVSGGGQDINMSDLVDDETYYPDRGEGEIRHAGNYLTVNVHDISVTAVNSMQGGNAVATSNIIIEPVQIIVCPSEVNTKLK
ncbi:MAG: hypothetical protein ACP5OU_02685 [Methanothrix sp.]